MQEFEIYRGDISAIKIAPKGYWVMFFWDHINQTIYFPLIAWAKMEDESIRPLIAGTGGAMIIGPHDGVVVPSHGKLTYGDVFIAPNTEIESIFFELDESEGANNVYS